MAWALEWRGGCKGRFGCSRVVRVHGMEEKEPKKVGIKFGVINEFLFHCLTLLSEFGVVWSELQVLAS